MPVFRGKQHGDIVMISLWSLADTWWWPELFPVKWRGKQALTSKQRQFESNCNKAQRIASQYLLHAGKMILDYET